jgi:hypothetical protein
VNYPSFHHSEESSFIYNILLKPLAVIYVNNENCGEYFKHWKQGQ